MEKKLDFFSRQKAAKSFKNLAQNYKKASCMLSPLFMVKTLVKGQIKTQHFIS